MNWQLFWEKTVGIIKYLIGGLTMVAGVTTATGPTTPLGGALGWLYSSRVSLVALGALAVIGGGYLIWAKFKRRRKHTGNALMFLYLLYTFATFLQAVASGFGSAIPNLVFAIICGLLYLRWRVKTAYVDPNHFVDDVALMRTDLPPPPIP